MARPSKLTPETVDKLTTAIKQGATYELACKFAGIAYNTLNEWRKRGRAELDRLDNPKARPRKSETAYVELYEAIQKAEGDATVYWLAQIQKSASEGNWQAAAWKLERRYPESYGRKVVDIRGNLNISLVNQVIEQAEAAGIDPAELFNELIAEIAHADSERDSE